MNRRNVNLAVLATLFGSLPSVYAQGTAAPWPTRPVRILVGFPAGSTPDIAARTISEPLSKALGQPVIVENRAGASGNIAGDLVAKATDDHTIGVVINGNLTTARMLNPKLPFEPGKDFAYLSLLATAPLLLIAPGGAPTGADFIAAAQKAGQKWSYGSVGVGSVGHLGTELLKTKVKELAPVHIPFKGNPEVVTALVGGEIQMALIPPGVAMPMVKAGKLRAIGVTGGRSALVPEVPPLADAGVRDFNLEVWTALVGPANLTKAARERLNAVIPDLVRSTAVRQQLFAQGWQAVGSSSEGLRSRVRDEAAAMQRIIATQGIKLD
jgi:tripartite-type tricarboxylate transporter receptor subunit TctC